MTLSEIDLLKFQQQGFVIIDEFISASQCSELLKRIKTTVKNQPPVRIRRIGGNRNLDYRPLTGERIQAELPEIWTLYEQLIAQLNTFPTIAPLSLHHDPVVGANINLVGPGGSYRWHYDRNAITATLYLNAVDGGELELCPRYRIHQGRIPYRHVQYLLDRLLQWQPLRQHLGKPQRVPPKAGRLLLIEGRRCLHSVREVQGTRERINLVFAYDEANSTRPKNNQLDNYLYEPDTKHRFDPNYLSD